MSNQPDLFIKTFDQQLSIAKDSINNVDISPNRREIGEVVFEPVLRGVRVTARDVNHRVLWGFIGSKEMITQIHCPVAVYETLQSLIDEELKKNNVLPRDPVDPIKAAQQALDNLQDTIKVLRNSITTNEVKEAEKRGSSTEDVGDATKKRASTIARLVNDADRMIWLEASSLRGMKKKGNVDSI